MGLLSCPLASFFSIPSLPLLAEGTTAAASLRDQNIVCGSLPDGAAAAAATLLLLCLLQVAQFEFGTVLALMHMLPLLCFLHLLPSSWRLETAIQTVSVWSSPTPSATRKKTLVQVLLWLQQ